MIDLSNLIPTKYDYTCLSIIIRNLNPLIYNNHFLIIFNIIEENSSKEI